MGVFTSLEDLGKRREPELGLAGARPYAHLVFARDLERRFYTFPSLLGLSSAGLSFAFQRCLSEHSHGSGRPVRI